MSDLNRELEELAELTRRVNEEMRLYGQVTAQTRDALKDAEMKQKYGIENYTKVTENAATSVKALGRSVTEGVAAMYANKKGMSAFNSSLGQLSTAATAAGAAMMLLGGPVAMVAGAATMAAAGLMKLFGVANEQSDAIFKGFQDLSKSGAAASDGMEGVFRGARRVGLGFQELDTYVRIIGESSKDLALFRGSVYEGRRSLEDINIAMFDQIDSLYAMGMTQEQVVEGSAAYLRLQSRIGLTQNKTANELAESTRKYLVEQDALTKLTGMTRKEQEDAREEIRSQERFAAVIAEMRAKRQTAQANELEKTYLILRSRSKDAAQGFADLTTGMVTTEAAQKATLATQGDAMRQGQRLKAGQASAVEAAQSIAKAYGLTAKQFNQLAQSGVFNNTFGDFVGAMELGIMQQHDLVKVAAEIEEDQKKAGIQGGKALDAETQKQIDMRKRQLLQTLSLQNSMNEISKASTATMGLFTTAIEVATDAIDWMVSRIPGFTPKTREEMTANRAVAQAEDDVKQLEVKVANARSKQDKEVFEKQLTAAKRQLLNAEVEAKYAKDRAAGKTANTVGGNQVRADGSIINPGDEDYVATAAPKRNTTRSPGASAPLSQEPAPRNAPSAKSATPPATASQARDTDPSAIQKPGELIIGPKADTSGMNPELLTRLENFARDSSKKVVLNSGYRSDEYQAQLWVRGNILKEPGIHTPARPKDDQTITYKGKEYFVKGSGKGSKHMQGLAADISVDGKLSSSKNEIDKLLAQHRLHRNLLPQDPPHVQMFADGGVVKAQPGGVPAIIGEGGNDEAVIPLKNGSVPVSFDSSLLIKKLSSGIAENTATDMARKMLQNTTVQNLNQVLSKQDAIVAALEQRDGAIPLRNGVVPVSFDSSLLFNKLSDGIFDRMSADLAEKMLQNSSAQNLNQVLAKQDAIVAAIEQRDMSIPLQNGAVPVSFDSNSLIGQLFAGISENTATDMAQKMLQNTTMQNLNQTLAKIQTPAVLSVDDGLKSQLSEILGSVRSELGDVVRQVGSEFRSAMDQAIRNMPRGTDNALAAEQLTLLSALVSEQKTANDISKKILYSQS